jgi:hypothetical protein
MVGTFSVVVAAPPQPPPFASAQSIEAFRVAPRWEKRKTTRRVFHDQKVIAGPRVLTHAASHAMAAELRRAYRIDWPLLYCAFVARYGVRLRLGTSTVEVLVCPHCGEVQFYRSGKWLRSASVTGGLLQLLQKTFPDHPLREKET